MRTAPDYRAHYEKEPLPFTFERCKGDSFYRGEVESIVKNILLFRAGNGKIMEIHINEKLKFPLPRDERISIVVKGKAGHYVLAKQLPRTPTAKKMFGGKSK